MIYIYNYGYKYFNNLEYIYLKIYFKYVFINNNII